MSKILLDLYHFCSYQHRHLFCRVLCLLVMLIFCVNEAVLSFFIWCFVVVKNLCSGNCSYFQAKFLDCWI